MKDIAIYGAGGFGREVACMINKINIVTKIWNFIGFFDDGKQANLEISHFGKVIGDINTLNNWNSSLSVVLCMGNPNTVKCIKSKISNTNIDFPNLIDPNFNIADKATFKIGSGNIIKGNCSVTTNVTIGNFNMLNGFVNIGHDVIINDYNTFMPGARISGEVQIGNLNLIGADSFVKQGLRIGNNITLSPLSALLTKPKDSTVYIGNPAKKFNF